MRERFQTIATGVTSLAGSPLALALAAGLIVVWLVSGPLFHFSDTWQLMINTTTTIITFLMVFVIQATTNRESKALQLKVDELIRAIQGARNELIAAEFSSDEHIARLQRDLLRTAHAARREAPASTDASTTPSGGGGTGRGRKNATTRSTAAKTAPRSARTARKAGS